MEITYTFYHQTLPQEARNIRQTIFVDEQGFEVEFDDIDERSWHIVVFCDGQAAATGRAFIEGEGWHFGRIAVMKEFRGQNIGALVMTQLEQKARDEGGTKAEVSAQCRVRPFYEKLGYQAVGEVYLDEYCEHIRMIKVL